MAEIENRAPKLEIRSLELKLELSTQLLCTHLPMTLILKMYGQELLTCFGQLLNVKKDTIPVFVQPLHLLKDTTLYCDRY